MVNEEKYVFISYKSEEIEKAREIQQYIEKEGYKCWRAPESLHNRGTQDYGNDIFEAIRNSACLLFVLSNRALCSDWVRKEVKYALEKCHKPIIPYVIDKIPAVKYDSDELMISLSLQKQILNEDLSNDLSNILRYIKNWITPGEQGNGGATSSARHHMTEDMFRIALDEINFYDSQIRKLSRIDYLEVGGEDRPFDVYQQELESSVRIVACGLIRVFRAISEGVVVRRGKYASRLLRRLYELTYNFGKYFNQDVFSLVESLARNGDPWACFVLHVKYYNPDVGGQEASNAQQMAFTLLSSAVKDPHNPYAAIFLGSCWQWGIGCDVSGVKALFWYKYALNGGAPGNGVRCPDAYSYIGKLYQYAPFGIERDNEKAEEYFKKGVAAHNAKAARWYGDFLLERNQYEEALAQYVAAYEWGDLIALADIVLVRKAVPDAKLSDGKYSDIDNRLEIQAEKANIPNLRSYQADPCFASWFGKKDEDAIISYATAGVIQKNPICATIVAEVMIQIAVDEAISKAGGMDVVRDASGVSAQPEVFEEIKQFFMDQLVQDKGFAAQYMKLAIGCSSDRKIQAANGAVLSTGYRDGFTPKSPFWRELVLTEMSKGPSSVERFNMFTPYKFLNAIKEYSAPNDSCLKTVKDIWELLRALDYERYDAGQIQKGHFFCLTSRSHSGGNDRLSRVMELIEKLVVYEPSLSSKWLPRIDGEKRASRARVRTMSLASLNNEILVCVNTLFDDIANLLGRSRELRLAMCLWMAERRLSPPALSVALDYYRLAYLWGSSSRVAQKMASLFMVNNGRLRDISKNEGLIYFIWAALEKAVYQMDIGPVPYFLEMCLFGATVGGSRVESNFAAIEKADAAIQGIVQKRNDQDLGNDIARLEIACAMAKIYNDSNLCDSAQCEQKWGVSSLYNPQRALLWLERTDAILNELKEYGNDGGEMDEFAKRLIERCYKIKIEVECEKDKLRVKGIKGNDVRSRLRKGLEDVRGEVDNDFAEAKTIDAIGEDAEENLADGVSAESGNGLSDQQTDVGSVAGVMDSKEGGSATEDARERQESHDAIKEIYEPPCQLAEVGLEWSGTVERAVRKFNSLYALQLSFFPHVAIEDDLVDVAVSTESTAVLLCVLSEGRDYEVLPKQGFEWHRGVPEIRPGTITLDFVDMLARTRATLENSEPDSDVMIGVVASAQTNRNIQKALEEQGANAGVQDVELKLYEYNKLVEQFTESFSEHEKLLPKGRSVDLFICSGTGGVSNGPDPCRQDRIARAKVLQQALINEGYSVFCDCNYSNGCDSFILETIKSCEAFILFYDECSFGGVTESKAGDGTMARRELEFALKESKAIVPLLASEVFANWQFPDSLPEALESLRNVPISEIDMGSFFEESVERLISERLPCNGKVGERQYEKGEDYYYGRNGVSQDYKSAVAYYQKSARHGNAEAQFSLGVMFRDAQGVPSNEIEATKWFRLASENGHMKSQRILGWRYQKGIGVDKNLQQAVAWYRKSAEQGYSVAQFDMGVMYDNGWGVEKDESEAVKWYRMAAEQGDDDAQFNLGVMYRNGQGVEKDEAEGVRWYRMAAEQGHVGAQVNLGYAYEYGEGVVQDLEEAVKWYRKAAEQGDVDAQSNLGYMYESGRGVAVDFEEAVTWYRRAAEQGQTRAQSNLGVMYEYGRGVDLNLEEAVTWYRRAAEQGHARAQVNLGLMYRNGQGVVRDDAEAARWYRKAAEQGNADAQLNLGYAYEHGEGVRQNVKEAAKWYRKAAAQGNEKAKLALADLPK